MFFYTAKFIWMLIQPLTFLTILLIAFAIAYAVTYRRIFARMLYLTIGLLALIGFFPVGHNMLVALETQYKRPQLSKSADIDGIIVLGGALRAKSSQQYGYPNLSASGSRLSEFIYLLQRFPNARAVFTGGSGDPFNQDISEANYARMFIQRINPAIRLDRIVFEGRSQNTFQNAVKSYERVNPAPESAWLFITSASHMPRAVAVFQASGWPDNLTAYPVDHRTNGQYQVLPNPDIQGNFKKLEKALHEYIGYVVYDFTNRI